MGKVNSKLINLNNLNFRNVNNKLDCSRQLNKLKCTKTRITKKDKEELNYPQYDIGHEDEWEENELKEVSITKDYKIVVYCHDGMFYAFGPKCPHKGFPLVNAVIVDGTIKCPLHGSEFDIESGICEDYPSYEGIPTFHVINVRGNLKVLIKETGVYSVSRPIGKVLSEQRIAVAIGCGASAVAFAQTLREGHWEGRIQLVSQEMEMPYDKTRLSETVHLQAKEMKLKDEAWYQNMRIELRPGSRVTRLNMRSRRIFVHNDYAPIVYSKLLIATGTRGKLPSATLVPGVDLQNVFTISNITEAQKVYDESKGKTVVIEGSGFVAMELVSTMKNHAKACYIVTRQKRPFQTVLGETVGKALQHHIQKLIPSLEFITFDEIRQIVGSGDGKVKMVKTLKKKQIQCDVVVYAIGSIPNSELFSENRGALTAKSGHIVVNEFCETNVTDVYAGGDVALVPLNCAVAGAASISHWNFASYTGKIAAARILNVDESSKHYVPYFYTSFCGINLRYTGFGEHFDESIIFGDLKEQPLKFCALYRRDRKILACATVNCDQIAARVCFNIGDHYQWEPGVYPKIITDTFPDKPLLGEEYFGFKLDREACVTLYDSQSTTADPIRRGKRETDDTHFRDAEFPLGLSEDKQMNYVFMN